MYNILKRIKLILFLLSINIFVVKALNAQAADALLYLEDVSVPSRSLAGAVTAKADDISMLNINPAALNSVDHFNVYLYQKLGFFANSLNYLAVGFNAYNQKFAVTMAMYYPDVIVEKDDFGIDLGGVSVFDVNTNFYWAYKKRIRNNSIFDGTYEFGVAFKLLYSKLLEFSTVSGVVDFGMVYRKKIESLVFLPHNAAENFSLGFSVLNQGPDVTYGQVSARQPLSTHFGMMYNFFSKKNHNTSFMLDGSTNQDWTLSLGMGMEYEVFEIVALRLGYRVNDPLKAFTMGMAVKYNYFEVYDIKFQYALGLLQNGLGNEHYIGLGFEYNRGAIRKKLDELAKKNRIWNKKIDREMVEMLKTCIKEYKEIHEKNPAYLDDVQPCIKEFGFDKLPVALTGTLRYYSDTGIVRIEKNTVKRRPDILYMTDDSIVKGKVKKVTKDLIHITNIAGTIMIQRSLIDYAVMSSVSDEDKGLLREVRKLIEEIKQNAGEYPDSVKDIKEYFKIKKGADMPNLSIGKWRYDKKKGKIMIIDNFNVSF